MAVTDVFKFHFARDDDPYEAYVPAQRRINSSRSSVKFVLVRGSQLEYRIKGRVGFPQPASNTEQFPQFLAFVDDHKAESFLFMPISGLSMRQEITSYTAIAAQTVFAFEHRYLRLDTVVVTDNGVVQDDPADYTVSGNNTAPLVTFGSAPGAGRTIVLTASFYVPVHFVNTPFEEGEGIGEENLLYADAPRVLEVEFVEIEAGARFVNKETASGGA